MYGSSLLLGFNLFTAGCTAIKSYPDRPVDITTQLTNLQWCFDSQMATQPPEKWDSTTWRNEVVNCQVHAYDLQFTAFEQGLSREGVGLNTGTDIAVVGLGAATTLVGGAAAKSILGAISGGITGTKGIVDKDIFYSKTMPALLAQMAAQRKAQLVKIRTGLQLPADEYPLSEALIDVEGYYKAGSIPAAVLGIVEEAGAKADQATKDLKRLQPATAMQVKSMTDIRARFNTLFRAWNDAPQTDPGKKALNDARTILKQLRPDITAEGNEVFVQLNEEIKNCGSAGSEQCQKVSNAFGF